MEWMQLLNLHTVKVKVEGRCCAQVQGHLQSHFFMRSVNTNKPCLSWQTVLVRAKGINGLVHSAKAHFCTQACARTYACTRPLLSMRGQLVLPFQSLPQVVEDLVVCWVHTK
jgi:hypothetical protein